MRFLEITDAVSKTVRSILYNPDLLHPFTKPCMIFAQKEIVALQTGPDTISIAFEPPAGKKLTESNFWVLKCSGSKTVSVVDLKDFKESLADFPSLKVKANFITCRAPFTREAVDFAMYNHIGLARITPHVLGNTYLSINDAVYSTSPLEIKYALCDHEFGQRRKQFYGFTSEGKIEHLGSLENYIRIELITLK